MRLIFVNRFFAPDTSATSQMLSDLATHLAKDHDVHVVTSRLRYDRPADALPAWERVAGSTVHRVWTTRFGRDSLLGRSVDYFTFYVAATVRLLLLVKRGDVVVPMTDPPLISVSAAIAARLKGGRLVNWIQDIFPEVAAELDFKRVAAGVADLLAWCRNRSLLMAARNVVLGEVMAGKVAALSTSSSRIRVIHNWACGEAIQPLLPERNPLRREWGLEGKFVVGYSGNMGRAHDLAGLIEAARRLLHRNDVTFLLIGSGKQWPELEAAARLHGLHNVVFKPYQPRELLSQSLTVPDCHIVSLKPSLEGLIMPSKLYSSMAAGRPIVFLGSDDGEIARLLKVPPTFGIRVDPADVTGLVQAIEDLSRDPDRSAALGRAARHVFEQQFDSRIAFAKWRALIAEIGVHPVQ